MLAGFQPSSTGCGASGDERANASAWASDGPAARTNPHPAHAARIITDMLVTQRRRVGELCVQEDLLCLFW